MFPNRAFRATADRRIVVPMEGDPWAPARVPIKICFTNVYIANLAQAEALPPGVILIDCRRLGLDADWEDRAQHRAALANYIRLVDRMIHCQLHMADRIYVHCTAGQVRSVTTVGIYLIRAGGLTLEQAFGYLVQALGVEWRDDYAQGVRVRRWLQEYVARYS
jgi:Dual specificity phosphatase, catalytic domain